MHWTNILIDLLLAVYVLDCAFMGLVILMQRSKQEGLGAAFGGGFTDSVWGAQTSNVLVKATVWLAALFFIISIGLARLYSYRSSVEHEMSPVQQELLQPVAPVKPAPAAAAVVPTATPMKPTPGIPAPTNTAPAQPTK